MCVYAICRNEIFLVLSFFLFCFVLFFFLFCLFYFYLSISIYMYISYICILYCIYSNTITIEEKNSDIVCMHAFMSLLCYYSPAMSHRRNKREFLHKENFLKSVILSSNIDTALLTSYVIFGYFQI